MVGGEIKEVFSDEIATSVGDARNIAISDQAFPDTRGDPKTQSSRVSFLLIGFIALLVCFSIPVLQIGFVYPLVWDSNYKHSVDRKECRNSCWDTAFKGTYETASSSGYKHVYFNAEPEVAIILFIILLYLLPFL